MHHPFTPRTFYIPTEVLDDPFSDRNFIRVSISQSVSMCFGIIGHLFNSQILNFKNSIFFLLPLTPSNLPLATNTYLLNHLCNSYMNIVSLRFVIAQINVFNAYVHRIC